jgi:bacillithiol synthase
MAAALEEASGRPVVPVFWLQTEDHDLPEIAGCGLPGAVVRVPASADDRVSIAHRVLPAEVARCLEELRVELAGLPFAAAHLERLGRHYRPGVAWGQAFAGVLAELFAGEGLVFVDPRDPALAAEARPVHERALLRAGAIAAALPAAPVHVRPGAPLSFYHPGGPEGPRVRLDPAGDDTFIEAGGGRAHTRRELLGELAEDPLRFSTSALLRPILQDTLLPTVAYVGGPAEVAYFAQLPPLYAAYELPMPAILPRARFRIVEPAARRLLGRLGLEPRDAERSEEELLARCRRPPVGAGLVTPDAVSERLLEPFEAAAETLVAELARVAPHLPRELARARGAVARSVGRLAGKVDRALLHQDRGLVADVRRLRALLHPGGLPQERCYGLPYFAARLGDQELCARILSEVDPFESSLKDLLA